MTELILRALARAGRTINNPFAMGGDYVRPRPGDAQRDYEKISQDMRRIGSDLKRVASRELERHDK